MDVPFENKNGIYVSDYGMVNRVPLCVSRTGEYYWCRRRAAPYQIECAELGKTPLVWAPLVDTGGATPFSLGPCK